MRQPAKIFLGCFFRTCYSFNNFYFININILEANRIYFGDGRINLVFIKQDLAQKFVYCLGQVIKNDNATSSLEFFFTLTINAYENKLFLKRENDAVLIICGKLSGNPNNSLDQISR